MKKFIFIIPIIFILSCTPPITTDDLIIKNPTASVVVTSVDQTYYPSLDEYSNYVTVNYSITNTGNCLIDYYKVNFTIICLGAPVTFKDWDNGTNVGIGQTVTDYAYIYVGGYPYYGNVIGNIELTSY